jgi:hypothetical protein
LNPRAKTTSPPAFSSQPLSISLPAFSPPPPRLQRASERRKCGPSGQFIPALSLRPPPPPPPLLITKSGTKRLREMDLLNAGAATAPAHTSMKRNKILLVEEKEQLGAISTLGTCTTPLKAMLAAANDRTIRRAFFPRPVSTLTSRAAQLHTYSALRIGDRDGGDGGGGGGGGMVVGWWWDGGMMGAVG